MSSRPPSPSDRGLRESLLALRAYARSRMSARLLAHESPSDIVQAVCEELLQSRHPQRGDPAGDDVALLRSLVRYKILERNRYWSRQKRAAAAGTGGVPDHHPTGLRGPETNAVLREWLRDLRAGVEQLPPRQREAIRMFYLDGRSMVEVGTALGCSEDAAKMLVSRGMQALRRMNHKD